MSNTRQVVVVEKYIMETLYAKGIYHDSHYFGKDDGMIEVNRTNILNNVVDIQLINTKTCMVLR